MPVPANNFFILSMLSASGFASCIVAFPCAAARRIISFNSSFCFFSVTMASSNSSLVMFFPLGFPSSAGLVSIAPVVVPVTFAFSSTFSASGFCFVFASDIYPSINFISSALMSEKLFTTSFASIIQSPRLLSLKPDACVYQALLPFLL